MVEGTPCNLSQCTPCDRKPIGFVATMSFTFAFELLTCVGAFFGPACVVPPNCRDL